MSAKPQYPPAFSTCQEHKLALLSTGSCVCLLDFSERGSGSGSRSHRSYFVDERPYLGNAKSVVRIVVENTFREKTTRTTAPTRECRGPLEIAPSVASMAPHMKSF